MTLIELLIAVALLALISLATGLTLNSSLENSRHLHQRSEAFERLSMALHMLRQDFEQASPRPTVMTQLADSTPRYLSAQSEDAEAEGERVRFTRTGRFQLPGGKAGSSLQHLRYRFHEGALIRESLPVPDPDTTQEVFSRTLLEGLTAVKFEFLSQEWQTGWGAIESERLAMPKAARITLTTQRWGDVVQLMLMPGSKHD